MVRSRPIERRIKNNLTRTIAGVNIDRLDQDVNDMTVPQFSKYSRRFKVGYKSNRPGIDPNSIRNKRNVSGDDIFILRKQCTNKAKKPVTRKRKSCKK